MNFGKAKRRMSSAEPSAMAANSNSPRSGADLDNEEQEQQQQLSKRTLNSVLSEDNINRSSSSVKCVSSSSAAASQEKVAARIAFSPFNSSTSTRDTGDKLREIKCDKVSNCRQIVVKEEELEEGEGGEETSVIPDWPSSRTDAVALGVTLDPASIQHHVFSLKNYSQVSIPGPASSQQTHSHLHPKAGAATNQPPKSINNPSSNNNQNQSNNTNTNISNITNNTNNNRFSIDHSNSSTQPNRKESITGQHLQAQVGESRMNRMRKLFVSPLSLRSQNSTSASASATTPSDQATSGYGSSASHSAELGTSSKGLGAKQAAPAFRPLAYPNKHHHLMSRPSSRKQALKAAAASSKQYRVYGCPLQLANNIYPITSFGSRATDCYKQQSVPYVLARLCNYIEENSSHLTHEGIFRVSGNARLMEKLRTLFDRLGDAPLESESVDVATSASMLKMYLRELPDPLIPTRMNCYFFALAKKYFPSNGSGGGQSNSSNHYNAGNSSSNSSSSTTIQQQQQQQQQHGQSHYKPISLTNSTIFTSGGGSQHLMNSADQQKLEAFSRDLAKLIRKLPLENYNLLRYLACFLYRVSLKQKYNKMCAEALGIVFGPNVFRIRGESYKNLKEQELSNQIMASIISNYKAVFDSELTDPLGNVVDLNEDNYSPSKQQEGSISQSTLLASSAELSAETSKQAPSAVPSSEQFTQDSSSTATVITRLQFTPKDDSHEPTSSRHVPPTARLETSGGVSTGGRLGEQMLEDEEENDDEDEDEDEDSFTSSDSASGSYCSSGSESLLYSYDDEDEEEDEDEDDDDPEDQHGAEELDDEPTLDDDDESLSTRNDRLEADLSSTDCDASSYTPTSSASLLDDEDAADNEDLDADEDSYHAPKLAALYQDSAEFANSTRQARVAKVGCKECRRRQSILQERRESMATVAAAVAASATQAIEASQQSTQEQTSSANVQSEVIGLESDEQHRYASDHCDAKKRQQQAHIDPIGDDNAAALQQKNHKTNGSRQRGTNMQNMFLGRRSSSASSLGRIKRTGRHHQASRNRAVQIAAADQQSRLRHSTHKRKAQLLATSSRQQQQIKPNVVGSSSDSATLFVAPSSSLLGNSRSNQRHPKASKSTSSGKSCVSSQKSASAAQVSRRKESSGCSGSQSYDKSDHNTQSRLQAHQHTFDAMMEASGWPQIHEQELQQIADYANCNATLQDDLMVVGAIALMRPYHSDETLFRSANFYTEFGDQLDSIVLNNESRRRFSGYDFSYALERLNLVSLGAFSPIGEQTFESLNDEEAEPVENSQTDPELALNETETAQTAPEAAFESGQEPFNLQASLVSLLVGCDSSCNSTAGSGCTSQKSPFKSKHTELSSSLANDSALALNCANDSFKSLGACDSYHERERHFQETFLNLSRQIVSFKMLVECLRDLANLLTSPLARETSQLLECLLKPLQNMDLPQTTATSAAHERQPNTDSAQELSARIAEGAIACQVDHLTARAFVPKFRDQIAQINNSMHKCSAQSCHVKIQDSLLGQLEQLIRARIGQFNQICKHLKRIRNHYRRSHRYAHLDTIEASPMAQLDACTGAKPTSLAFDDMSNDEIGQGTRRSSISQCLKENAQASTNNHISRSTPDGIDKLVNSAASLNDMSNSSNSSSETSLVSDNPTNKFDDAASSDTTTTSHAANQQIDCRSGPICPIEFVFNIERLLTSKRNADNRNVQLTQMSLEQLNNEKLDLQKNLLRYERWFGRPPMSANVASHLYQRYQLVKIIKNHLQPTTTKAAAIRTTS